MQGPRQTSWFGAVQVGHRAGMDTFAGLGRGLGRFAESRRHGSSESGLARACQQGTWANSARAQAD